MKDKIGQLPNKEAIEIIQDKVKSILRENIPVSNLFDIEIEQDGEDVNITLTYPRSNTCP